MISSEVKRLCDALKPAQEPGEEAGPYIAIEQLTSRFGVLYEKVRSLVDYKEAHVIRRSAIRRILKRQIYLERANNVGKALLHELVSGGYLPNNQVPEAKATDISDIVHKWVLLEHEGLKAPYPLDFAAIEVERFLYPDQVTDVVAQAFYESVRQSLVYQGVSNRNNALTTLAATRQSLLSEDQPALMYAFLLEAVPSIATHGGIDQYFLELAPQVLSTVRLGEKVVKDPLVWKVAARLKNRALYFSVLMEVLHAYGKGAELIFDDEQKLREMSKSIIEKKQKRERKQLQVSGRRAVIYLLLTKIVLGVALEWPYEHFILGSENYVALATNGLFHPILLLLMVTLHRSDKRGVQRVVDGVVTIVRGDEQKQIFIRPPISETTFFFVALFYVILFAITFGAILTGLIALHFNLVSIILFFVFLTLVSYFGIRIRSSARRSEPEVENPGTLGLLWNLFTFPIVRTGKWFSVRFSTINVFVLFLDFLVEMPFKAFLAVFDASLAFIKEHRVDTN